MARNHYTFAKRQRDLAKKRKKEEKRQRKAQAAAGEATPGEATPENTPQPPVDDATEV